MIKENRDIKAIIIGQTEHKISQFADDAELFQRRNDSGPRWFWK